MTKDRSRMMDVEYLAKLARIALTEDEIRLFKRQLLDILGYLDDIEQVDVQNVEPTSHMIPVENVFRPDKRQKGLDPEDALANASEHDDGQFTVPRMVT